MSRVDLTRPSFAGAFHHAKEAAFASMRAGRRDALNEADKAAGNAVLIPLLWLVEASEGGLMGMDDAARETFCRRYRLDEKQVAEAAWAPRNWPAPAAAEQVAA